jgi:hypothetical protein
MTRLRFPVFTVIFLFTTTSVLILQRINKRAPGLCSECKVAGAWSWRPECVKLCHRTHIIRLYFDHCFLKMAVFYDGGSKDLWNVGELLPDYTALQPRRRPSSYSPPWEPQIQHCFFVLFVRWGMHTKVWSDSLKGKEYFEDLGVCGRIISRRIESGLRRCG